VILAGSGPGTHTRRPREIGTAGRRLPTGGEGK
jgi:hypothetical protein